MRRMRPVMLPTRSRNQRANLPDNQEQPLMLARNLFLKPRRQRAAIARAQTGEVFDERPIKRFDIADALAVQQSFDAIAVSCALLDETLTFTGAPLAILLLNGRHMDNAANPWLAPQIGEERPHQLLKID